MLYFVLEKAGIGFPKGQTPPDVKHRDPDGDKKVEYRESNRGAQSQWVPMESRDSRVAEETKRTTNPKVLPLGFLFKGQVVNANKMREPRVYLQGAVYYTSAKAGAGELLFRDDADYAYFLGILKERKIKYNFKLYAFCLLPQHYHLLIETSDKNISKIMQALNTSYSLYYNNKYNRQGHLLAGRFQMKVVNKDATLLELTYHIQLNPLRMGLLKAPEEY